MNLADGSFDVHFPGKLMVEGDLNLCCRSSLMVDNFSLNRCLDSLFLFLVKVKETNLLTENSKFHFFANSSIFFSFLKWASLVFGFVV